MNNQFKFFLTEHGTWYAAIAIERINDKVQDFELTYFEKQMVPP